MKLWDDDYASLAGFEFKDLAKFFVWGDYGFYHWWIHIDGRNTGGSNFTDITGE